jgi:hypothetical protein
MVADLDPATARIVRNGVAEVTADGSTVCVTLPTSTADAPTVQQGAC